MLEDPAESEKRDDDPTAYPVGPMSSGTLSDLLRAVRLTGAVFFDIDASAPWVEIQPTGPKIASSVLPGAQHLISYHAVTEGTCFDGPVGADPIGGRRRDRLSARRSRYSTSHTSSCGADGSGRDDLARPVS